MPRTPMTYKVINEDTGQVVHTLKATCAVEAFVKWNDLDPQHKKPLALYIRVGHQD